VLSENVYWQGRDAASLRALHTLTAQDIGLSALPAGLDASASDRVISVTLVNHGREPAVALDVTALDRHGHRVLPAYYSANYITLMPFETRRIQILCPRHGARCANVQLQGWNAIAATARVEVGG
jgi:hypothetical protein